MKKFKLINNITGWCVFVIAAVVYLMTIEPTASWWDCSEFISTSYRFEVGHPPGAPFFNILARFFSLFAKDAAHVAMMVNSMSALASAFTILFLFWTITHLAKKIILKNQESDITPPQLLTIMGSGVVGALAYTFSDTFWFSAVEGEVYASSSLFTALVFWAILKWENVAGQKHSSRWIILIAYLMGLSIGVHLLNLLAIPAIVLVYYFKKYPFSKKGVVYALLISLGILGGMMYILIPGVIKLAASFELFFVNSLGLPFNSGVVIYLLLLISAVIYGLYYTYKHGKAVWNTIILAFAVILIGYSSFAMVVIRSWVDPPINENNPDNVFSLLYYLNREQYGDRPLLYGQCYSAPVRKYKEGKPTYTQLNGRYEVTSHKVEVEFDPAFNMIFPRMYSSDPSHISVYQNWANIKGTRISTTDEKGEQVTLVKPTFFENLSFFFKYQLGYMYFRYFLWNFSGRQNDVQGQGGILHGNWITGIPFFDSFRLGPQKDLPSSLTSNKGRNRYFMLPLLLGLLGLMYHYQRHSKDAWVVMSLFILTGIAIVVYLNQTPLQPRERDYAYAGSFYAFCIWIGIGVMAVSDMLKSKSHPVATTVLATLICLLCVPCLMAEQNWNDHDRSGRYTVRDIAADYLNSCAPNAILFTGGDNDTFPLWYAQEVEGIRTDVRVVNLMLLNMDWYIDQMKWKSYQSDPLPISLSSDKYIEGKRNMVYIIEKMKDYAGIKDVIDFIASDDPRTKFESDNNEEVAYMPTRKVLVPVDSATVLHNGTVDPKNAGEIVPYLEWTIPGSYLTKSDLLVLDMIANNNWKRPIYFTATGREGCLSLDNYLQLEGFAYRLVPLETVAKDNYLSVGRIDTKVMYNNMMNIFKWGRMNQPHVLIDEFNLRTFLIIKLRNNFNRLASALLDEGKRDSAVKVLDRCVELTPHNQVPYDFYMAEIAETYLRAHEVKKAKAIIGKLFAVTDEDLKYYLGLSKSYVRMIDYDTKISLQTLQELGRITKEYQLAPLSDEINQKFSNYYNLFMVKTNQ